MVKQGSERCISVQNKLIIQNKQKSVRNITIAREYIGNNSKSKKVNNQIGLLLLVQVHHQQFNTVRIWFVFLLHNKT